jgi:hypothetical protein
MSACTCGYDDCRHKGDEEDSSSTTGGISSEADLLQQQYGRPASSLHHQTAVAAVDDDRTVCFSDELVRRNLLYGRCPADGCGDSSPPVAVVRPGGGGGSASAGGLYDRVGAGGGGSDSVADRVMRTFKGSPSTRNQMSTTSSAAAANTLPRLHGGAAPRGDYESGLYRALGAGNHICS